MKTTFTILALLLCCFGASAQNVIDLSINQQSPVNGQHIPPRQAFTCNLMIKNAGPATLNPIDTLALYQLINGDTLSVFFNNNLVKYRSYGGRTVAPGDSFLISIPMVFDTSFLGQQLNFCWAVSPLPLGINPLQDTSTANNIACASILVADEQTSIATTTAGSSPVAQLYPNPARGTAAFHLSLPKPGEVTVRIFNTLGQQLAQATQAMSGTADLQVPLTGFAAGLYYYAVSVNGTPAGRASFEVAP